tara:strand:+ start:456 stop:797 length:342 start_codon:yes stop_codon:yes gene_type:complete
MYENIRILSFLGKLNETLTKSIEPMILVDVNSLFRIMVDPQVEQVIGLVPAIPLEEPQRFINIESKSIIASEPAADDLTEHYNQSLKDAKLFPPMPDDVPRNWYFHFVTNTVN